MSRRQRGKPIINKRLLESPKLCVPLNLLRKVTGSLTQSTIHDGTTYLTTNRVSLNANGNLLAGVANKKIRIHAIWGQGTANIEGDIQDGSGGTNIIHFKFNDREGFLPPALYAPMFWGINAAVNTAMYITFTTAGQSYWTMVYSLV